MKKSRFAEEQIAFCLRQHEGGTSVLKIVRKLGISEQTFSLWKKKYAGLGVAERRRLKQLEEGNTKLKQLVADLSLGKLKVADAARPDEYVALLEGCARLIVAGLGFCFPSRNVGDEAWRRAA